MSCSSSETEIIQFVLLIGKNHSNAPITTNLISSILIPWLYFDGVYCLPTVQLCTHPPKFYNNLSDDKTYCQAQLRNVALLEHVRHRHTATCHTATRHAWNCEAG